MTGFAIGEDGDEVSVTPFRGVVDTGGPNMGLPKEIVEPYFASFGGVPAAGASHIFPCDRYPPPALVLKMVSGDSLVLNSTWLVAGAISPWNNGSCHGRVDDSLQTSYNIGACVLDQKFVVFDHANSRIGFADKASLAAETHDSEPACTGAANSPVMI